MSSFFIDYILWGFILAPPIILWWVMWWKIWDGALRWMGWSPAKWAKSFLDECEWVYKKAWLGIKRFYWYKIKGYKPRGRKKDEKETA